MKDLARVNAALAPRRIKLHEAGMLIVAQCLDCGESWVPPTITLGKKPDAGKCPKCVPKP